MAQPLKCQSVQSSDSDSFGTGRFHTNGFPSITFKALEIISTYLGHFFLLIFLFRFRAVEDFALIELWQLRHNVLADSLESRWNGELQRKGYLSQIVRDIISKCKAESWMESLLKQVIN